MALLGEAFAAILGGVSGGLVSYFVSKSLLRDQVRERAKEKVFDLMADLSGAIQAYWGSSGRDAGLENSIVSGIQKCSVQLKGVGVDSGADAEVRVALTNLYKIATGGEFQSNDRKADGARARNANKALEELASVIDRRCRH